MKKCFTSGLSIFFLRLSTGETEVFAAKQAEVWQKVKRLIHFFCQSKKKNILIFSESREPELKFTVRNIVCVCVAKPNKEATGWRLAPSVAMLDLSESEDLGKTSSGSAEASRGEIRSGGDISLADRRCTLFFLFIFSPPLAANQD